MNAHESTIPYPWLVFNERVKVKCLFIHDSTAVSDSVLLLFGGSILKGDAVKSFIYILSEQIHLKAEYINFAQSLTGWSYKDVGRILGILYGPVYSGNF